MSLWTDALTDERVGKTKYLYGELQKIGWDNLSRTDRKIMLLLGWFSLEENDSGEPLALIENETVRKRAKSTRFGKELDNEGPDEDDELED